MSKTTNLIPAKRGGGEFVFYFKRIKSKIYGAANTLYEDKISNQNTNTLTYNSKLYIKRVKKQEITKISR